MGDSCRLSAGSADDSDYSRVRRGAFMTGGICDGRTVIVTGAGRGIGREYALEFARQGASVVVNDLGVDRSGAGASSAPAADVADEIRAAGGTAITNGEDVSDFDGAKRLVTAAIQEFGQLDVLVNNAGILRDRTIVNMDIDEWDAVIRVHLRGTFAPMHWAAAHWRERAKVSGPVGARLINTSSSSGLYSNPGQVNYAAAKAGIASLTIVASRELARYGVTANAVYPTALSRLTQETFRRAGVVDDSPSEGFDPYNPVNIAPVVVWLGSKESDDVTGRVLGIRGNRIVVAESWAAGPTATTERRWASEEIGDVLRPLLAAAAPNATGTGQREERRG
jgi:NAD(P)-dependent dehydrogenase (short-subunit alcohol dehydrogenase family)